MAFYTRDALENVKRQIKEHRKAEARQNTQTTQERRLYILDDNNPMNATFPWLCAAFVNKLVGGEKDSVSVIPPGILNVVYLYKFMEQLSTGHGFREATVLAMTTGNRFFDTLLTCFKTLVGFYIVTDHVKSTPLHNFIKRQERFNDDELRFYAEELVCAVDFLHSRGIIHRNLTAGNIKLTAEGHIKVFNLEHAYIAIDNNGKRVEHPKVDGMVGLDAYMPPEMIDRELYSFTVDWWSLGVILYFMMNGKMPFRGNTRRELHRDIKYSVPKFDEGLHSPTTHSLVKAFLEKNPKKRLGMKGPAEVLGHEYFMDTEWSKVLNGQNDPPFFPATSAVTSLPSAICLSLEHLTGSEPVQKCVSRGDLARLEDANIAPDQFNDFELAHDWTCYLHPGVPLESAMHYMHGELRPPKQEGDYLNMEECITRVPELSEQERSIFREYAYASFVEPERLVRREARDGSFRLLTPRAARAYDEDPEEYCRDLRADGTPDEDTDLVYPLSSQDVSPYQSSSDQSAIHSVPSTSKSRKFGGFLTLLNPEEGSSLSTLGQGVAGKIKNTLKDSIKLWKRSKTIEKEGSRMLEIPNTKSDHDEKAEVKSQVTIVVDDSHL